MSPIGRIFVVLNIVLAAVIFGIAASFLAKNDNYRFRYEEAVRDKDKTTADLEAERDAINEQRQAAERLRDQTLTEKTQLENQKAALEDDIAALNTEKDALQASVGTYNDKLDSLTSSVETMNGTVENTNEARLAAVEKANEETRKAEQAIAAQAAAEDRANALEKQLADARAESASLASQLQQTDAALDIAVAQLGTSRQDIGMAAPPISGAVTSVTDLNGTPIIQINKGALDQVKVGYKFEIYNTATNEYKGQAIVELLHPNTCTAVVTLKSDTTAVMQGDKAATVL